MRCMECGGLTKVVDSRWIEGGHIRRRRECLVCGGRFNTLEQIISEDVVCKVKKEPHYTHTYEYCFRKKEYQGLNCKFCPFKERCE